MLELARPTHDGLNRLLSACNQVAARYAQPQLYADGTASASPPGLVGSSPAAMGKPAPAFNENVDRKLTTPEETATRADRIEKRASLLDRTACFHVSIAWSLASPDCSVVEMVVPPDLRSALCELQVPVSDVKLKIGNAITSFRLGQRDNGKVRRYWLGAG